MKRFLKSIEFISISLKGVGYVIVTVGVLWFGENLSSSMEEIAGPNAEDKLFAINPITVILSLKAAVAEGRGWIILLLSLPFIGMSAALEKFLEYLKRKQTSIPF